MNYQTRKFINELADNIRMAFHIETPILDMSEIVSRMQGNLIQTSHGVDISSGFIRKKDDSFEIVVPFSQSEVRKNFTIAHELGHLFLHMGYIIAPDIWQGQDNKEYHRYGISEAESQANEFAAAFLMPQVEYKRVMEDNCQGNLVNTANIAKHFNVSIEAAANRGKWLGYLQW